MPFETFVLFFVLGVIAVLTRSNRRSVASGEVLKISLAGCERPPAVRS
jgi:hypothetical protein